MSSLAADAGAAPPPDAPALRRLRARQHGSVAARASRGVASTAVSRVAQQGLQFAGTIALARLLSPAQFGLSAAVLSISAFATLISNLGLGACIVQSRTADEALLATAFWISALAGLVLTVALVLLSVPLAAAFGKPQVDGLIVVASLNFVLNLGVVPIAMLERVLLFGALARIELAGAACGVAASIALAADGAGAYSLVIGPVVSTAVVAVLVTARVRWRPTARPTPEAARQIWRYGSGLLGFSFVSYWSRNVDNLLLARYASEQSLGYYSRAYNLMLLPTSQVTSVVNRVLFPALSELRGDAASMARAWLTSTRLALAVTFPIAVGMAVSTPDLVRTAFGPAWNGMVPILGILALAALPQILGSTVSAIYQVLGRTRLMAKRGLLGAVITVLCIVAGLHWGAIGVSVGVLVATLVNVQVTIFIALRLLDVRVARLVAAVRGAALASAVMAATVLGVRAALPGPSAGRLAVDVAVGALSYAGALWALDRATALRLARPVLRRLGSA